MYSLKGYNYSPKGETIPQKDWTFPKKRLIPIPINYLL